VPSPGKVSEGCPTPDMKMETFTSLYAPYEVLWSSADWLSFCGFTDSEVAGQTLKIIQGPDTDPDVLVALMDAVARLDTIHLTLVNYTKHGIPFTHTIDVEPLADSTGNAVLYKVSSSDVRVNHPQGLLPSLSFNPRLAQHDGMPSVGAPSSEPTVATRVVTASPVHASPYSPESTLNSREKSTPAAVFASAVAPPPQLVASAWASRTGAMRDETVDQVGMDDDAASAAGTRNASLVDSSFSQVSHLIDEAEADAAEAAWAKAEAAVMADGGTWDGKTPLFDGVALEKPVSTAMLH